MCQALCSVLAGVLQHRGGAGGLAFQGRGFQGLGDGTWAQPRQSSGQNSNSTEKFWVWGVSPGRCWGWDWTDWRGVKGGVGLAGQEQTWETQWTSVLLPGDPLVGGGAPLQPVYVGGLREQS